MRSFARRTSHNSIFLFLGLSRTFLSPSLVVCQWSVAADPPSPACDAPDQATGWPQLLLQLLLPPPLPRRRRPASCYRCPSRRSSPCLRRPVNLSTEAISPLRGCTRARTQRHRRSCSCGVNTGGQLSGRCSARSEDAAHRGDARLQRHVGGGGSSRSCDWRVG